MLQSYSGLSYVLRCYSLILGCLDCLTCYSLILCLFWSVLQSYSGLILGCLDCLTCYSLILGCLTFLGVTGLFCAYSGLSYVLRCYSLILVCLTFLGATGLFWAVLRS